MTTLCESMVVIEGGCEPSRAVLRYEPGAYQPFVTHIEIIPADRPSHYWAGHYFSDFGEAVTDFGIRARQLIAKAVADNTPEEVAS